MLITLVYGSAATKQMTAEELKDILAVSHENNKSIDVTGILLYKGGNFLQVLEGEEDVVNALYERIYSDQRHFEPMVYFRRPIQERMFSDWSMGFRNLDKINPDDLPGYNSYLDEPLNSERFTKNPSAVETFLSIFKEDMR